MRQPLLFASTLVLTVALAGCNETDKANTEVDTVQSTDIELLSQEQKMSYIMGSSVGAQFLSQDITVDMTAFTAGFEDVSNEREPRLSEEVIKQTIEQYEQGLHAKHEAVQAEQAEAQLIAGEANKKEGDEFLASNSQLENVVTTESGLQYKVLQAATGNKPSATDRVSVHYKGRLLDGTEFDSSYTHGAPAEFGVNQVIPGWVEALQLMQEGAKWELYIPAELAYGPGGTGGVIGPNATLIFEVELLKVISEES